MPEKLGIRISDSMFSFDRELTRIYCGAYNKLQRAE